MVPMAKPTICSGKFLLRVGPDLHARLAAEAKAAGRSLNAHCVRLLSGAAPGDRLAALGLDKALLDALLAAFPVRPIAVVLFGSCARGADTAASDVDLLIVLPPGTRISRDLYRDADRVLDSAACAREPSPHVVALPDDAAEAGSLWLEAAMDGAVLVDEDGRTSALLGRLRDAVAGGDVRRRFVHGHPYWVRD